MEPHFNWLSTGDRVLPKLAINSGNPYLATTDPWLLDCTISGQHYWIHPLQKTSLVSEVDQIICLAGPSSRLMGDIISGINIAVGFLREDSRLAFSSGRRRVLCYVRGD